MLKTWQYSIHRKLFFPRICVATLLDLDLISLTQIGYRVVLHALWNRSTQTLRGNVLRAREEFIMQGILALPAWQDFLVGRNCYTLAAMGL